MDMLDAINQLFDQKLKIDDHRFQCSKGFNKLHPIIRGLLLLTQNIESLDRKVVFNVPNSSAFFSSLVLGQLVEKILTKEIISKYDPSTFVVGNKYMYKERVVEFLGYDEKFIKFKLKNGWNMISIPHRYAPKFQITNTDRKLSTQKAFGQVYTAQDEMEMSESMTHDINRQIEDHKTHLDGTVFVVSRSKGFLSSIENCRFNDQSLSELVLIGKISIDDDLCFLSDNKYAGSPTLAVSNDLECVVEYSQKYEGNKWVIIDISSFNKLESHLDSLDALISWGIPIIIFDDHTNSFDYSLIKSRDFLTWKWNQNSLMLIKDTFDNRNDSISRTIDNYMHRTIEPICAEGQTITRCFQTLSSHKDYVDTYSPNMSEVFYHLFHVTFALLRRVVPFSDHEIRNHKESLLDCEKKLRKEKRFIAGEIYNDYTEVIEGLQNILSNSNHLVKIQNFNDIVKQSVHKATCLVVHKRESKDEIQNYIKQQLNIDHNNLTILYPKEYLEHKGKTFELVVTSGWFGKVAMKDIYYGADSRRVTPLLYPIELKWHESALGKWENQIRQDDNAEILSKILKTDVLEKTRVQSADITPETCEIDSIESIILKCRFKRYELDKSDNSAISVYALPIGFSDGTSTFYGASHSLLLVNDVLRDSNGQVQNIKVSKLSIGDVVAIKEADKDIIKEVADVILQNNGESHAREVARQWKKIIDRCKATITDEEIYRRIKEAGCSRNKITIRQWISDDSMVIPRKKEDLEIIIKALSESQLSEVDKIFEHGSIVHSAHISAGRHISKMLGKHLETYISEYDSIDDRVIEFPKQVEIDDLGTIILYKISVIGEPMNVDKSMIGRLFEK
jgi:hypothetical protein